MRSVFNSTILLTFLISSCAYAQTTAISMRSISGGQFQMGSPMSEFERQKDETQHQVSLSAFEIAPYEVSQSLYEEVMGNNPSADVGKNLPVENITWYDAIRFCNALSQKEGLEPAYVIEQDNGHIKVTWNREASGYRLPTESEWEYAARAGTTTPFNTGENISADQANYYGTYPYRDRPSQTYHGETVPIGSFSANAWGLYDMHGNVWEWCWDRYGPYPQDQISVDPQGSPFGQLRVNRGGGFNDFGKHLRSSYRAAQNPLNKSFNIGLRLARNVE